MAPTGLYGQAVYHVAQRHGHSLTLQIIVFIRFFYTPGIQQMKLCQTGFKPLKFFITSTKPIIIAPPDAGAFPASAYKQGRAKPEAGNKIQLYSSAGALLIT